MFAPVVDEDAAAALRRLHDALDELSTLGLDTRSDTEVLGLWQQLEAERNRLAVVDHALFGQAQARHLHAVTGAKNTTGLARQLLRVSAGEARLRERAADALGARRGLTGEALQPIYPQVAAAQAEGALSESAARIIVHTIEKLPDAVRAEHDRAVEACLLEHARTLDVDALRTAATRVAAHLDPDGLLKDHDYRDRHRELNMRVRQDGSSHLEGELTAEATEHLRTLLDTLAAPKPEAAGQKDPRTPAQRRHDALLEILKLVERAELLPYAAGLSSTIILTMDAHAYATGRGTATTGHGAVVPASEAKRWAGAEARVMTVLRNHLRPVEAYSSTHRLFTEQQRLALISRDKGCSFPYCDAPPQYTQAHHVIDYGDGGPTTVANGTLLCGPHHRWFTQYGWGCTMIHGHPHWIPPRHLDPDQTPLRNHMHDPIPHAGD